MTQDQVTNEQQEGTATPTEPVRSCMFGDLKMVPIAEDFGEGLGWYEVTLKVRPLTDGKPREIPAEFLHQTLAEEMTHVTLWMWEMLRTGCREILA